MASQSPVRSGHHPPPAALEGPDKVAALLLAMGRPIAGRLLVHFAPNELKAVTRAAADLPAISPAAIPSTRLTTSSAAPANAANAVRFRRGWFLGDGTGAGKGQRASNEAGASSRRHRGALIG